MRLGLLLLAVLVTGSQSLRKEEFYPFGDEQNDLRLTLGDDVSSEEIHLNTPVAFYDSYIPSLYVNSNGHITFGTDLPNYNPTLILPFGIKTISVFFSDVDTRITGNVYYRETADPSLLDLASSEVRLYFPDHADFQPGRLFIATWDSVGYFQEGHDKTNSYQVVLASDARNTFCLFHYARDLDWIVSDGKYTPHTDDIPAQVGFDAGDGRRSLRLPNSGSRQVARLASESNVDQPGKWIFRIGNLFGEEVEEPRQGMSPPGGNGVEPSSCATGSEGCHDNAVCEDVRPNGFCCKCMDGYTGNGINCIEKAAPQRVNGKVSGTVNGQVLEDLDLHAYILTKDGRTYTAIGRVNAALGHALQALYPVGGVLGWLFASSTQPRAINGFSIAGGDLTRTATIRFVSTNQTVTLQQTFVGEDVVGHLSMDTIIRGNVPNIAPGARLEVPDFSVEYRRTDPGILQAFTRHRYMVDGVPYHLVVDQTLIFNECEARPLADLPSLRLSVSRTHVVYQEAEELVRFSMVNKMGVAGSDPCLEVGAGFCDPRAHCVAVGSQPRCRCNDGYEGDGTRCTDIDECRGSSPCDPVNGECVNQPGSYQCRCRPGYLLAADGATCQLDLSCADLVCHPRARCVYDSDIGQPRCECGTGFMGDGVSCEPVEFGCNEVDNCDPNADCVFDEYESRYRCECADGFSGDGVSCTDTGEVELNCRGCDAAAECIFDVARLTYRCQCIAGYTGDGRSCSPIGGETGCDVINDCDVNARCVYDPNAQGYRCVCQEGWTGDGVRCAQQTCDVINNCAREASCIYDNVNGRYGCQCRDGYQGDGMTCSEQGCDVNNYCDRNADCVYDHRQGRYTCRCRYGYEGDGATCQQQNIGCNQLKNCDINADCVPDNSREYYCLCRSGYTGDGYSCRLTANCRRDPSICDVNARCEPRGTDYVCVCQRGYQGDGRRCAPVGDSRSYLLYTQEMSIMEVPFVTSEQDKGRVVLYIPGQKAIGLSVDCYSRYFYWTDVSGKLISRAKLDGTDSEVLVTGLGSPEGIAVDWITRTIYWTDSGVDRIEASRLDGTYRKTIINEGLVNPRGIVVDPRRGYLFWSDWNRDAPVIERANLDGTGRTVLVEDGLGLPNGLTIDYSLEKICWADAGTQNVECVDYQGRGRQTIYSLASYPFDVVLANNRFYWTDWDMRSLPNIDRYGSSFAGEPLTLPPGGNGRLYGITSVESQCPAGSNACALNNGGCTYLCLATPNGGRTCACPDEVGEEECSRVGLIK